MNKIFDAKRREALRILAIETINNVDPAPEKLDDKFALYSWVADQLGTDAAVTYLEFGVDAGTSIKFISEKFINPEAVFYGFDSFQGLPQPWLHLPQFAFDKKGHAPRIADERVRFVKGWFQNTVPPFMEQWTMPTGPVLIHFDADLYSSTIFALTMTWPHIRNYYFMMDDFLTDDAIALNDFAASFPVKVEFLAQAGRDGNGKAVPSWVFGRVRSVVFEPEPSA